jgi:endoribonuclease LACTB2
MSKSVDAIYEQFRLAMPVEGQVAQVLTSVASRIRVLALRTPTLPPAAHTNAYLVGPPEGPVAVVDPGSPYPDQQAALDAVLADLPIALVLLTHHHGDHVGGAAALAARWNVPIAAHAATARRLKFPIARELVDGEVVEVGGTPITAVHTPGHADGHLCFEVDGATIAGDMVAGVGTILIDPSEGDMGQYFASLELLLARGSQLLLPAHGEPITDGPGKLREYLVHRRMREATVLAATAVEHSVAELVATVYADTPRMLWPLAERSLLAHLAKLVAESRVREVAPGRFLRTNEL